MSEREDVRMALAYIVCRDVAEAKGIGRVLLEKRLAGCVNIFPIESAYWWEGQIVDDHEVVLLAKTVDDKFPALQEEVLRLHSYAVPAVLKLPVSAVQPSYLQWLTCEVR